MAWSEFALALALFLASHAVPVRAPLRPLLDHILGRAGFTMAYSALSLAMLAWLIGAAGRAPYVPLWYPAPWQNHVVLAAMLPVCLIVALALGTPNPFSFGGGRDGAFDPHRPGIVAWMRHPLLVAMAIWATAHGLANGDLAHVVMFGVFAAFSIAGMGPIDRRRKRLLGDEWTRLRTAVAARPKPSPLAMTAASPIRATAGFLLYAGLLVVHPLLFGVDPLG